jgi:hypothetical protein
VEGSLFVIRRGADLSMEKRRCAFLGEAASPNRRCSQRDLETFYLVRLRRGPVVNPDESFHFRRIRIGLGIDG